MASTKRINYIAVFYIGDNRDYENYQELSKTDPLYFIERHIEFLATCSDEVALASFVVNDDISDELKEEINNAVYKLAIPTEVIFRKNGGYSYGGWNDVIKKNLSDYDYFFMIEDDYVPEDTEAFRPFLERITDETPYVCCVANHGTVGKFHAANSNAMVSAEACRKVFQKTGDVFRVKDDAVDIREAWQIQINFLDSFTEMGYTIRDILDEYSVIHPVNCHDNQISIYGDIDKPTPIKPILLVN